MGEWPTDWIGLAVALGCGLLIGIERERRKGRGAGRAYAGVRTFTVAALAGAIAQSIGQPLLVAACALLLVALSAVHYARQRSTDPGITTEIALFLTFLLGVTAVIQPALAGGGAVIVAALLAARHRLHRFSTQVISEHELRDGLILAGAALVVLPLIPDRPLPWLAQIQPRLLWRLVVLLLALQAMGHVALRVFGARTGLLISGLAAGFVSSTATHAAMGGQARERPTLSRACAAGALASNLATMIQLALVAAAVSAAMLRVIGPMLVAGAVVAIASAALLSWPGSGQRRADPNAEASATSNRRLFDLRASLVFATLLTALTASVAALGQHYGTRAALSGSTLAGLVDVHAALASIGTLVEQGSLPASEARLPLLLAGTANLASKLAAATLGGGWRFAVRVAPGSLAIAAAWLACHLLDI